VNIQQAVDGSLKRLQVEAVDTGAHPSFR